MNHVDPASPASALPLRTPPSPVRIAHVTDFYAPRVGGIEIHVAGLARQQRRAGHVVDVITGGGLVERSSHNAPNSVDRSRVSIASRAVLDGGYNLVHVHAGLATPVAFAVARAASRAGLPTTVTLHSMIGGLAPLYRVAGRLTGWPDWPIAWSAVSTAAAAPLRQLLGPDGRVDVLPNAIDLQDWRPQPRFSRRDDEVVVISVMRLAHRKRPLPLLRVLRDAQRMAGPATRLRSLIVGDGSQRPAMERYLSRHRIDWVQLVGQADHDTIRRLFRRADLFVAPARHESFGIAALEARAAGLPVVALAASGVGEFLESGVAGQLVEDDIEMSSAIAALAADRARLAAMTVHNQLVTPRFGWPLALQRTEAVYGRAMRLQGVVMARGRSLFPGPAARPGHDVAAPA